MDLLVLRPPRQRVLLRGEASKLFELLLRQALECKWNEPELGLNGQGLKENALNEALSLLLALICAKLPGPFLLCHS